MAISELWFRLRFWWWRTFHPKEYQQELDADAKAGADLVNVFAGIAMIAALISKKGQTADTITDLSAKLSEALGVAKDEPHKE